MVDQTLAEYVNKHICPTSIVRWLQENISGDVNKLKALIEKKDVAFGRRGDRSTRPDIGVDSFQVFTSEELSNCIVYWNTGAKIMMTNMLLGDTNEPDPYEYYCGYGG